MGYHTNSSEVHPIESNQQRKPSLERVSWRAR